MTDSALRGLERAARARPDDPAAGWAYARALERAGERRALWTELSRVARLGDVDAGAALDAWLPGVGGTAPPRLASLENGRDVRVVGFDGRGLRPPVHRVLPLGRHELVVQLEQSLALLHVDPARPRLTTLTTEAQHAALVGDDLLALVGWSTTRAYVEPATGESLAGAFVGPGVELGAIAWAAASRDRALLIDAGSPTARAFDVATPASTLWTAGVEDGTAVAGGGLAMWGTDDAGVIARSFETGVVLWRTVPGASSDGRGPPALQADARGVVVLRDFVDEHDEQTFVSELDPRTGATRWIEALPLVHDLARTPDLVLVRDEKPGLQRVVALERAGGRVRWRAQWPDPSAGDFARETAWAVGDGAVYLATVERGTNPRVVFTALDLEGGRTRFALEVDLPNPFSLAEPDAPGIGLCVDGERVSVVVSGLRDLGVLAVVEIGDR